MAYKVKGPHTFTLGYTGQNSVPDLIQPGQDLPADLNLKDLLNLARENNLTDSDNGQYDAVVDEKTGNEKLVKLGQDKDGNPTYTEVTGAGVVTGQPSEPEIKNDPQLNEGNQPPTNNDQQVDVVGA